MTHLLDTYQKDKLSFLATGVLFLFPVGMASIHHWASGSFYLLTMLAFFALRRQPTEPLLGQRWLMIGIALFVGCALLSFINADDIDNGHKRLVKIIPIILLLPILFGFRRLTIRSTKILSRGIILGGFAMGGISIFSTVVLGKARASGYYHPIIFGDLAIIIAAIAVCTVITGVMTGIWRWLVPCVVPVAIIASLFSQSRGGWVAIPFVVMLLLVLYSAKLGKIKLFTGLILMFLVIVSSPYIFPGSIGTQFERTQHSIEKFMTGEQQNSSLGARFLMWDVALQIWQENPIIGSGLGDFRHDSRSLIESGKTNLQRPWHHAHNIFFEYLSMTGLLGLFAMLASLFVIPFSIFYKYWYLSENSDEEYSSLAGMIIVTCFFVFGLSEVWLARSVFVTTYALFIGIFLSSLGKNPGVDSHLV